MASRSVRWDSPPAARPLGRTWLRGCVRRRCALLDPARGRAGCVSARRSYEASPRAAWAAVLRCRCQARLCCLFVLRRYRGLSGRARRALPERCTSEEVRSSFGAGGRVAGSVSLPQAPGSDTRLRSAQTRGTRREHAPSFWARLADERFRSGAGSGRAPPASHGRPGTVWADTAKCAKSSLNSITIKGLNSADVRRNISPYSSCFTRNVRGDVARRAFRAPH